MTPQRVRSLLLSRAMAGVASSQAPQPRPILQLAAGQTLYHIEPRHATQAHLSLFGPRALVAFVHPRRVRQSDQLHIASPGVLICDEARALLCYAPDLPDDYALDHQLAELSSRQAAFAASAHLSHPSPDLVRFLAATNGQRALFALDIEARSRLPLPAQLGLAFHGSGGAYVLHALALPSGERGA